MEESGLITSMRPSPRLDPTSASKLPQRGGRPQGRPATALAEVVCRRSMQRVLWHDERLAASIVKALWENPNQLISTGTMLKDGDRCTVVKVEESQIGAAPTSAADSQAGATAAPTALVLKRYNRKGQTHTAVHWFLRSRARWSWLNGRRLLAAGLPTPRPLACVDDRKHGILNTASFLLTEFVPGTPLREVIEKGNPSQHELRDFAQQFVAIWRTLGLMRIGHGDMKATNFIVDSRKKLWLIDLDGLRVYRTSAMLRRERRNDMARFLRNWTDLPEAAAIFRARIGTR